MIEHNKLVRDKILEIIISSGSVPHFRTIEGDDDYLKALLDKDVEEGLELAKDPCVEELADKLEVLYAIAKALGYTPEQVETARLAKLEERGGFDQRIFLERTE